MQQRLNIARTIFRETASLSGKTALLEGSCALTYGQLAQAVDRLAQELAERGVRPLDRVAFLCPDCIDYVLLSLAILSLDAAIIPISPGLMADELADQFAVPQVGIKVWGVDAAYAGAPFAQGVSEDAKVFASSLTEPFCGVNTGLEAIHWLPDPKAVASLAILPLRAGPVGSTAPAFGLLVLASPDAQRFNSTMGTEFLARVAELASAALSPLR
jgi:acyl-coenzyme A synthetase/AMP-(fatty) acid ligase